MSDAHQHGCYSPLIEHPDDSAGYTLGWEMGLLFGRLDAKPAAWSGTYHSENEGQIVKTAAACGYAVTVTPSGVTGWVYCDFTRAGLRLVGGE